jgi:iron complex outermembrane receptor protein
MLACTGEGHKEMGDTSMNKPGLFRIRVFMPALASAAALWPMGVHAQSAASAGSSDTLEEVIVTAARRAESLQNTAISASVLSGEALEDKGVKDLYTVQYAAPAVTISGYGSANVFNIRGIGRSQVDIDVPSGVVIYRDGAPTLAGYFQNEPYFDMDSVQVFRGPQGTFVGKSAAGGAVFINTKDPELGSGFSGSVEGDVGNYSAKDFTGVLNMPVSDTFAVRLAYKHYDRDHFYHSLTGNFTGHPGEVDNNSVRLGLLWQPNANLTNVLKIDYSDLDFGGNPTSVYGEDPLGDLVQNADFAYTDKSLRTVLDIKYKTDGGTTFASLSGYQDVDTVNNLDVNATVPTYYYFQSKANVKIFSQEFNLISPDNQAVKWVVGAFYQKQKADIPTWEHGGFNFIGNGFPPTYPWATTPWQKTEDEWAVFGHVAYNLNDAWQLEMGARYSDYRMDQFTAWLLNFGDVSGFFPPVLGNPGVFPWPGTSPDGERQKLSEDTVDGQVAVNWTVNDRHFLYGLVSRGHITGGVNLFPPFDSYREMQVINYELGWKANFLEDRFRTQATVFYETFNNYQANFAEVTVSGLNNPTNRNAETESHMWGIELSAQAHVGGLHLDLGAAYLDSKLGTFSDVQDPFSDPTQPIGPLNQGPPPAAQIPHIVNLSGARVPFAPTFTGNLGLSYDIPVGAGLTLTPRVDVSHLGEAQAALWSEPWVTLKARTLTNGLLTLEPDSKKWSAALWVTNASNKTYVAGIQNNATLYYAGAPRQYGLRVKFNF